jgi:cytidyltransferase-like protein
VIRTFGMIDTGPDSTLRTETPYREDDVVLMGGVFDLFHIGHLSFLKRAKMLGGSLAIAVLSDRYVRSYKGPTRPIQPEKDRLAIIRAIRFVDHAWITNVSPNTPEAINQIQPRALVFGIAEEPVFYEKRRQQAADLLAHYPDLDICFMPRSSPEVSTSILIQRIQLLGPAEISGRSTKATVEQL